MPLTEITQPVAHIAQATAVVVGGSWAYAKYVRGRAFRHRAKLNVEASLLAFDGDHVLAVKASMKNEGLSRIRFRDRRQLILFVDSLPATRWAADTNVLWDEEPTMATPLFEQHGWIEPGETIDQELLVPMAVDPAAPSLAYQVRAWVGIPSRLRRKVTTWSANTVLPVTIQKLDLARSGADGLVSDQESIVAPPAAEDPRPPGQADGGPAPAPAS